VELQCTLRVMRDVRLRVGAALRGACALLLRLCDKWDVWCSGGCRFVLFKRVVIMINEDTQAQQRVQPEGYLLRREIVLIH
jgi:hypothetical protein